MRKILVTVMLVLLILSFLAPAFANEPKEKLTRGLANVLSAVIEIPQNIDIEWKLSKNAGVGIFTGFFKGMFWGVARCASGLWDIVTFPFPKPVDYNSVIQPEYVQRGVQTHFIIDQPKTK